MNQYGMFFVQISTELQACTKNSPKELYTKQPTPTRNLFELKGNSNVHKKAAGNCASEIMNSRRKLNSIYKYAASGGS